MKYEQVPYHCQYDQNKLLEGKTIYSKQEIILVLGQEICWINTCVLIVLPQQRGAV